MKVFITGIAGFLGSRIAKDLLSKGHQVSGCDNLIGGYLDNVPDDAEFFQVDCMYLNAMKKIIKDHDVVIHTACTAYEGLSVFSPHVVTQNTFQISSTVFAACAANHVKRVINCSSMARYGHQEVIPFREHAVPVPVDPYGISKLAAEQVLQVLSEVHGFEFVNLVPHNIIGAHQKYDDPFRNVASIMINLMLRGKQPIVYGDGLQKRCFSDVRDILTCFSQALDNKVAAGQTINIGPDEEFITILDLAKTIADVLNFKNLEPVFVAPRPREVKYATCSADKARNIFNYKTNHTLRQSIEEMAQWIEKRGAKKFRYHLDVEIINEKTPKTWTEKLFT
ncbi:UDP-glucose 4-epimerase [Ereboglobus sp. PH5-10]|uniref:NAD-dependent epimerase/dehydratase family protein n=1 Tax=Ereboglobus sp. PH5-10 TaxID=2940629 RepID=UPI0024067F41|nr:NAD(P)-dependent oxidoreductase [Ereboglobus sp. PH5-10]MDF9827430.1 UDP-glucose 4-epimerase [Ereboglobus sp. PH5-10]